MPTGSVAVMNNRPIWLETPIARFPKLSSRQKFDVVVVGGGITGLTTAYLLKHSGKKVAVLERDALALADTGHTTAHLTYVTDLRLSEMAKTFGRDEACLVWIGGQTAIQTIEAISIRESINSQFQRIPGFLHAALHGKKDESDELKKDWQLAREFGFQANFLPSVPFIGKPGIRFANQAKFNPRAYLAGLVKAIVGDGSAIFEASEVEEIRGDPLVLKANGYEVECADVVIATHVPLMGKTGLVSATLMQSKLAPYSSYVIGGTVPRGKLPEASFWDTSDPYYYLRVDKGTDHDYVIFGGKDYKTGQESDTEQCYQDLENVLREIVEEVAIDHRWSGQVIETNDGLPYIGATEEHQYVATGFAGNGMTFGTLAGMILSDRILGKENPWQELLDVNRKKIVGGTWDYVRENLDYPYYLLKDRLRPAEGKSVEDVKLGEGKILKLDGERVACYRDANNRVTMVSAICTHMGCVVHWNDAEQTWDCPCHGSRFQTDGKVIGGPAETPLKKVGD